MSTIPASELVNVTPSVLPAGGAGLDVIALMLTNGTRVPIGSVLSFASAAAVSTYFGATSQEAALAAIYFGGFTGSNKTPGSLLFAQYNQAAVSAFVRGGLAPTLAAIQALDGTLSVTIDGTVKSATVNLTGAGSFTGAAGIIANSLGITGVAGASFNGQISGTTLTINSVTSGTVQINSVIAGSGVTAGTYITAFVTGTGTTGTYTVSASQSVSAEGMTATNPAVQYDSVSGAFEILSGTTGTSSTITYASGAISAALGLTQATAAVLSQGAAAAVPSTFMNALIVTNSAWVTFLTTFDPDNGSGNANKQLFAAWKNTQNNRYAYICSDPDVTPAASVPATSSLGYILANNNDSGTCLNWETGQNLSAFICGAAASVDYTQINGRITFAYKQQAGIAANVTDPTTATNLGGNPQATSSRGNGYNFYGAYAQASQQFVWYQRGFVTGQYLWLDSFINQIWLNAQFVNALLTLLGSVKSIPYATSGYALIGQALQSVIQQGLTFGAFAPGTISASEIASVNQAAGANVATTLQAQGYYLQILPASSTVRANRGSPPCTFWYLDRGSVQAINLASIEVQ